MMLPQDTYIVRIFGRHNDSHSDAHTVNLIVSRAKEHEKHSATGPWKANKGKTTSDGKSSLDLRLIWDDVPELTRPRDWPPPKKTFVTLQICFVTMAVYIGPSIYSSSTDGIREAFGASHLVATCGLTISLIFFSIGSMLWAGLSEVPAIGKTNVYIATLLLYVILQIPTALTPNLGVLLAFRAMAAFFGGSWVIGGSSIADMYAPATSVYAMSLWDLAGYLAPFVGPLLGNIAAQYRSWRWPLWISIWCPAGALVMLLLFLPETGEDNILHRKAKKLSKLTSQEVRPEIDGKLPTFYDVAVQPFVLLFTEPIALFIDVYIGLANAIAYLWLESFPIVFQGGYGFETHQGGLAYLGLIVGGIITIPPLWLYFKVHQVPQFRNPHASPEKRMPPALVGSILMPICLFWFGWSAEMGANWIVTVIGSSIFGIAEVLLYASIYPYLTDLYPDYAASALAGNVFLRSVMGACLPLGGHALYSNLGTGWASTLLGLLSCLFIPLPFILWKKGGDIRRKSRRAIH